MKKKRRDNDMELEMRRGKGMAKVEEKGNLRNSVIITTMRAGAASPIFVGEMVFCESFDRRRSRFESSRVENKRSQGSVSCMSRSRLRARCRRSLAR